MNDESKNVGFLCSCVVDFFASQESKWSKLIYAAKTVKIRVPIWGMPRRRRKTRNAGWSPHALALVCAEMAGARANCPARPWYCYLLVNRNNNNTYVGATVDVPRRYRQHMGWLSGGARATSRFKTWRLSMYVPLYSKTAALQFEWRAKRARGSTSRRLLFKNLCAQVQAVPIDCDELRSAILTTSN